MKGRNNVGSVVDLFLAVHRLVKKVGSYKNLVEQLVKEPVVKNESKLEKDVIGDILNTQNWF